MLDTTIRVKTDHFDGPLALLLLLVQKEEMDIKSLDLSNITQQYLNYLSQMQSLDFDVAGDYLYLAATLLLLKSKVCLTDEDANGLAHLTDDADLKIASQSELIKRLEELDRFQKLSKKLWALPKKGHEIFVKPKVDRKAIVNSILTPVELNKLTMVMVELLQREKKKYTVVKREKLSIRDKLIFLKGFFEENQKSDFETILQNCGEMDAGNLVITFISLLELARLNKISIFQNDDKGTIYLEVKESFSDFDVSLADGFEPEEDKPEMDAKSISIQ
ncbi:MAG: segregation/condensation protein A [Bdellovibrionales bacterium]|nr:segregation/condensation protein A [Bdellovibrionales bacterium]